MIVGYLLANRYGELLLIPRLIERNVAVALGLRGWVAYRAVTA